MMGVCQGCQQSNKVHERYGNLLTILRLAVTLALFLYVFWYKFLYD